MTPGTPDRSLLLCKNDLTKNEDRKEHHECKDYVFMHRVPPLSLFLLSLFLPIFYLFPLSFTKVTGTSVLYKTIKEKSHVFCSETCLKRFSIYLIKNLRGGDQPRLWIVSLLVVLFLLWSLGSSILSGYTTKVH